LHGEDFVQVPPGTAELLCVNGPSRHKRINGLDSASPSHPGVERGPGIDSPDLVSVFKPRVDSHYYPGLSNPFGLTHG